MIIRLILIVHQRRQILCPSLLFRNVTEVIISFKSRIILGPKINIVSDDLFPLRATINVHYTISILVGLFVLGLETTPSCCSISTFSNSKYLVSHDVFDITSFAAICLLLFSPAIIEKLIYVSILRSHWISNNSVHDLLFIVAILFLTDMHFFKRTMSKVIFCRVTCKSESASILRRILGLSVALGQVFDFLKATTSKLAFVFWLSDGANFSAFIK